MPPTWPSCAPGRWPTSADRPTAADFLTHIRERRLRAREATILKHFEQHDCRAIIPMRDIVLFALATARREAEITRLHWDLRDARARDR